jgi:hypothetical protein
VAKKHKCPHCGRPTEGTVSEGGVTFALCEDCYRKEYSCWCGARRYEEEETLKPVRIDLSLCLASCKRDF